MSDSNTTSLDQLPVSSNINTAPIQPQATEPTLPNLQNSENIKIENYGQQLNTERQNNPSNIAPIDYTSQLTSVLKEANAAGATVLPSRDLPQTTSHIQHDIQTQAGHIPNQDKTNDYIGNILNKEKIIIESKKKQNHNDNLEYIYQSLQIPILIAILYFLFQLPIIRKNMLTFLPNLFNKDGMPKLSGYVFNSIMFALFYLVMIKGLKYLQDL
tara:strand:- start:84 stop:725 length:642 start_codon:yes stop_codon:yes gene_type:complete